jgi:hypothetical protein
LPHADHAPVRQGGCFSLRFGQRHVRSDNSRAWTGIRDFA